MTTWTQYESDDPTGDHFGLNSDSENPPRDFRELLRQVLLVTLGGFIYFGVRGLTEGSPAEAEARGLGILEWEESLGIAIEREAQALIANSEMLVTISNWVYIWFHWPVIIATLVWLHRNHRVQYLLLRNAMFISGAIGMVIFALYPVAPPRLTEAGFVDTVTELSNSYRILQPPALVNKYAAVPSLHVGWNLLVGIVILTVARHKITRVFAALSPLAMIVAVVLTANHYVVDAVAGIIVAMVGLTLAQKLPERWRTVRPVDRTANGVIEASISP